MGASLPPKEANLFKLIVKSYEAKQYKKGLKAADAILKKFPEHGETLAMKGLTLNCMERKAEAYDLVRKGLKNDLKSHVCWHVYGLLYRSDREYREAIKCYRNALRIDPENIQILRDLSLLQAQMRDLVGFVETRRQLLTLKPNHRNNWIGFAIAHHLNGTPDMAVQILEAYEGTMEDENSPENERENERYEHSEMLLYKVSLLEEAKSLERAFEELDKKEQKIVDKLGVREQRASLLLELGRLEEAELVYRNLLDINPDNYGYYEGLQKCLGLSKDEGSVYTAEQSEKLSELYDQLQKKFPSSAAAKRIPLDFLERDAFYKAADDYIRPFLRKGVPSLFSDLRPLYHYPEKVDALEHLFLQVESSLRTTGTFPSSSQPEPPSVLMWLLYLLAQHYDRRRNFDKALEKIDEAIKHTPTAIDLYLVKGRILRHAGDAVAAANLADEARSMDLADRYLNSECVKRMLQADQIEKAEKTAVLFTKDGDQHNNLYDMQCIWYELASGDSHFRQGALGRALKKYLAVEKHYNDMVEDQFDFHTYCLRKMTLRAYIRMLRFQDHLHSHRFFHRAAVAIIRCYLKLYDSPPKTAAEEDEATAAGLSSAERKKMRQKLRKAEARAKKEAEEKAKEDETNVGNKGGKKGSQTSKPIDSDPDGDKLLQVEDPLGEALKYLKLLQEHSPNSVETHLLAFEVYIRKQKLLLAFQAIKRQLRTHKEDPAVHLCMVRFFHIVDKLSEPKTPAETRVREVIAIERSSLRSFARNGLMEINQEFLDAHNASLQHRVAAAEALLILSPERKAQALKIVEDSIDTTNGGLELKQCISVHQLLESTFHDPEAALRWGSHCAEMFPYSTYFGGAKSSKAERIPIIAALNARACHTDAANGIIENVEAVKIN